MQTKSKTWFLSSFSGPYTRWGTRGTWSNKLLDTEALTKPGVVGWSGTKDMKMSKWFLNRGKSPEFSFRKFTGSRLNNLAP